MDEIFKNMISEIKDDSNELQYIAARRYDEYYRNSEIPKNCYGFGDQSIIPPKLNNLFRNIKTAADDGYNFLILVNDYSNIAYLAYLLSQALFKQCILDEDLPNRQFLYINTKLVLEDYKNLIEPENSNRCCQTLYNMKTLTTNIFTVPMLVWDFFTEQESNYDKSKVNYIISRRYNEGLGNIYFATGGLTRLQELLGKETYELMHIDLCFDCTHYKFDIPNRKDVGIFRC